MAKFTPSRYTPDIIHILEYALSTYIQLYISVLCIPHVAFNFCDMLLNILGLTIILRFVFIFWVLFIFGVVFMFGVVFFGLSSFFWVVFKYWLIVIFGGQTVQNRVKQDQRRSSMLKRDQPSKQGLLTVLVILIWNVHDPNQILWGGQKFCFIWTCVKRPVIQ